MFQLGIGLISQLMTSQQTLKTSASSEILSMLFSLAILSLPNQKHNTRILTSFL